MGTKERRARWTEVIARCEVLAEELEHLLAGDGLAEQAIPFGQALPGS